MALLDHSFHDYDIESWIQNFTDLTEPEYLLSSMDELVLTPDSEEIRALLKKEKGDSDKTIYDQILDALTDKKMDVLYFWTLDPSLFIKETGIAYDDDRYIKFLSEFIPGFIMYRNQWDRNQLGKEIREFINNLNQPYNRRATRLKKCHSCGYNITDLFAIRLTANNILDDSPVAVICPHCNTLNYIKY